MSMLNDRHSEESVTLEQIFEALGHPARRQILMDLAERNARAMGEFATEQSGANDRAHAASIELTHVHLPRLDDAGFIDWDPETETITRGPNFDELRPHLDVLRERN